MATVFAAKQIFVDDQHIVDLDMAESSKSPVIIHVLALT